MKISGSYFNRGLMSNNIELPLLPLRDVVVFPSMVVPLNVGRQKSVKAIDFAMKKDKLLFLVTQKMSNIDIPSAKDLFKVGIIGEILQLLKMPDGHLRVLVEGVNRAKISDYIDGDEYVKVIVEPNDIDVKQSVETEALRRNVIAEFEHYVKLNRKISAETIMNITSIEDFSRLSDSIASHVSVKVEEKQKLLEIVDPVKRVKELLFILKRERDVLKVEKKIHESVREQMEKTQKDYYLNEQLKAIKKELGTSGDGEDEIDELRKTFGKIKAPKEVKEKAEKELKRLEKMPPMSAESSVIRTYLEWLKDLPWSYKTKDNRDLDHAETVLDEDHYGLKKVKERILEFIAVRQLVKKSKGQILCFVGPPGVGKTSLARSIARSLGRKFVRLSLGGVRDEAEIRGHRRTYVGALPGRIIQSLKKAGSKNSVFLLDEVDKMSTDFRGDPSAALLEVLDPEQNDTFSDHYLELPFDLSEIFFITTANNKYSIPHPLLDRMELIDLPGYTEYEKLKIANQFLLDKQIKENGLKESNITIKDAVITDIIRYYTREAGVRNLERNIATICRKIAKLVVKEGNEYSAAITSNQLQKYLGPKKFRYGEKEEKDEIGVATGLAWTESGGDILSIEVSVVKGKGNLILTGKLGEVMQESAQAALSYARSMASEFGLPGEFWKNNDIHIHVPEGAIPKDGPSAGITIATSLISALAKVPVKNNVAMTGEITLRGKVLPIGGLKEKVLAAHRALINTIIVPDENKKDFEDIPKSVVKKISFHFVKTMDEVLKIAMSGDIGKKKKKKNSGGSMEKKDIVVPDIKKWDEDSVPPMV